MDNATRFKEAIKVGFAFALVYAIALKINWLVPGWAGWSVIAIAALPGGQALQKGLLRILGTLLACTAGILIISAGSQNRWLFMIYATCWSFFCAYKMLSNKKLSNFWFVTGYVTLVITAAGPSPVGGFYIALYRAMETILGIVVYTLVAVFIWPLTNPGLIRKSLKTLLNTQTELLKGAYDLLTWNIQTRQTEALRQDLVKQTGQFNQSLIAERTENYEVQELMPLWNQFKDLNCRLLKSFDRIFEGIEDLSSVKGLVNDTRISLFFKELENRYSEISALFSGQKPIYKVQKVNVRMENFNRTQLSNLDIAALYIIIDELNMIETLSRTMVDVAVEINGFEQTTHKTENKNINFNPADGSFIKVFDIEYLKGSLFVAAAIVLGFLIWFYVNPPGHSAWYILGGVFALIFAGVPQVKTTRLVLPFLIAMILASLIYVFVIPLLTNVIELGLVLFTCMFLIKYFVPGPASLIFTIAVIQLIPINNPQTYNASSMLNSFVFIPMLMLYLFGLSYITSTSRPEKAMIKLINRFFESAKYLISLQPVDSRGSSSYIRRYRTSFYWHELHTLPAKIRLWGKAIDKELFPDTDIKQIEEMTNALDLFIVRMEILAEASSNSQDKNITLFKEILTDWQNRLEKAFDSWYVITENEIKPNADEQVLNWLNQLENQLKGILARYENVLSEEDGVRVYHLLGGYRGVTQATLEFVRIADKLNWNEWKQERFE